MKKLYAYITVILLFSLGWISCQSNNKVNQHLRDSLMATNSSDSSILDYALGLEKLINTYNKSESPVYKKGDYSFYTVIFEKDSLPVIYKEYGDSGNYGSTTKKYYLNDGELVLYIEKLKQSTGGDKPNYDFKETRVFYRNNVFLRADERKAESDSLLNQTPFTLVDASLIDKNQQFDFQRIEDATHTTGEYNLVFNRLDSVSSRKMKLVLNNSSAYQSIFQVTKPDSLIQKIKASPYSYKGKKLNIKYNREGSNMIYQSGALAF
ncbi:MAG: hypothetical protein ABIP95_10685 [Pelobium sp.]